MIRERLLDRAIRKEILQMNRLLRIVYPDTHNNVPRASQYAYHPVDKRQEESFRSLRQCRIERVNEQKAVLSRGGNCLIRQEIHNVFVDVQSRSQFSVILNAQFINW